MPLPVPAILGHSDELGIIALQDLGDVTLQAHLGAAPPARHAALYRQAVRSSRRCSGAGRARVARLRPLPDRLRRREAHVELQFFTKHFLEAYRGAQISAAAREALAAEYAASWRSWRRSRACCVTATITAGT